MVCSLERIVGHIEDVICRKVVGLLIFSMRKDVNQLAVTDGGKESMS